MRGGGAVVLEDETRTSAGRTATGVPSAPRAPYCNRDGLRTRPSANIDCGYHKLEKPKGELLEFSMNYSNADRSRRQLLFVSSDIYKVYESITL